MTNKTSSGTITIDMSGTQNIKIRKTTLQKIRMIHALTDEMMMDVVERLARAELENLVTTISPGWAKTASASVDDIDWQSISNIVRDRCKHDPQT